MGRRIVKGAESRYILDPMDDANGGRSDSRDHARQPIELKVEYKRLNSFFSDYTRNISKGGTFIKTGKPLDVGTEFVFKLQVPTMDEPLRIRGRVQWVVTQDDLEAGRSRGRTEPGMGIRFVYLGDEERTAIERTVETVMVDSLGRRLYSQLMDHSRTADDGADSPKGSAGSSGSSERGESMDSLSMPGTDGQARIPPARHPSSDGDD